MSQARQYRDTTQVAERNAAALAAESANLAAAIEVVSGAPSETDLAAIVHVIAHQRYLAHALHLPKDDWGPEAKTTPRHGATRWQPYNRTYLSRLR